ncbi:MAG TPA: ABC-F family ATP-binding cassette domain-containing protein [Miltoncostaeaceae bacterium]|nr:ABC-F family ATP-binding cassette domain-containing protein [Miltoncostaeaceae bacterium]
MPPRTLVSLQGAGAVRGARTILADVTLGVAEGDRIGVVGRNGGGKSTLLRILAGLDPPDGGVVTRVTGLSAGLVGQADALDGARTVREVLVGGRADHEWAGDPRMREVLAGLLGGVGLRRLPGGLDAQVGRLSGGERRRVALARLLLDAPELLLLDEPTNHLDVEGVDWLARHLAARRGALVVVTHDRWFLDAACTATWEVADGGVHRYDGGYAAYVLARAERERQEAARDARRRNLLRKELAWLRRGPPARTSKPRFRIEAANALIADEPPVRDRAELLRFAASRLGTRVLDLEGVSVAVPDGGGDGGRRWLLRDVTLRLGPGDRVALVGVNGAGKTTLMRLLDGARDPDAGEVRRGPTVRVAHLTQEVAEVPGELTVIESLERVRRRVVLADGTEMTASTLCERFGFRGARARTRVRELSGGERRRLQLMRLVMEEPNVLLLDEPTNDLDTDTLAALEDLLDGWPGTLVVVSHDRYFVERVCDDVHGLLGDGRLRHLPGGVEQYLRLRRAAEEAPAAPAPRRTGAPTAGAQLRSARKEAQRLERELDRLGAQEAALEQEMATVATDHARLRELTAAHGALRARRSELEEAWLAAAEAAEAAT